MSTVHDINIAVVGAAGVGKTTFIERAYDLPAPVRHGEVHSLTMVMDRTPCSVSLVDVDWNRIDFDKEQMQWPRVSGAGPVNVSSRTAASDTGEKVADGQRIPFIDGVLLLFDTTHPRMVDRLTECLGECCPRLHISPKGKQLLMPKFRSIRCGPTSCLSGPN